MILIFINVERNAVWVRFVKLSLFMKTKEYKNRVMPNYEHHESSSSYQVLRITWSELRFGGII